METLFYSFTVDRLSIPCLGAYEMIYATIQADHSRCIQYERLTVAIGVEDIMVTISKVLVDDGFFEFLANLKITREGQTYNAVILVPHAKS